MNEQLKTSAEWYAIYFPENDMILTSPAGWDQSNYQYSFYQERITLSAFAYRLILSKYTIKKRPAYALP